MIFQPAISRLDSDQSKDNSIKLIVMPHCDIYSIIYGKDGKVE